MSAIIAPNLIEDLLRWVARQPQPASGPQAEPPDPAGYEPGQIVTALNAGLGPLLHMALERQGLPRLEGHADRMRAAHLTALVRHGNAVQVATAVIDLCSRLNVPVTLLKGISISEQHYPAGELRPMGDIDILVAAGSSMAVEEAMVEAGFVQNSVVRVAPGRHHGTPLYEPRHQVWVEIHTGLFTSSSQLHGGTLFTTGQLEAWSVESTFHGRKVLQLKPELQLAYLASSWVRDMSRQRVHPSFVLQLFDALYLLQATEGTLEWDALLRMLDNESATASVYLLLSYLRARDWYHAPQPTLALLASRQTLVRPQELAALHWLLDRFLLRERAPSSLAGHWHATLAFNTLFAAGTRWGKWLQLPWNILFPAPLAERYQWRFHLARVARRLRWRR